MRTLRLLRGLVEPGGEEECSVILERGGVRIERIVSRGHRSPDGFWYDQETDEWVMLLAGKALLSIEGEAAPTPLETGDALFLPAHLRHRVEWTDPEDLTVWLAVHLSGKTGHSSGRPPEGDSPQG